MFPQTFAMPVSAEDSMVFVIDDDDAVERFAAAPSRIAWHEGRGLCLDHGFCPKLPAKRPRMPHS